jgi:hypothetical protein
MILGLFLLLSILESATITIDKTTYFPGEPIEVTFLGMEGNQNDWIGIYPEGSDISIWGNVKKWETLNGVTSGQTVIDNGNVIPGVLPAGRYEVHAFNNNSFNSEAQSSFTVANYEYGNQGNFVTTRNEGIIVKDKDDNIINNNDVDIYHPVNWDNSTPIVFFIPGGNDSSDGRSFEELFYFISSHGYSVAFLPRTLGSQTNDTVSYIMNYYNSHIDETKVGITGWSNGGGATFEVLKYMIEEGYGTEGRLLVNFDGSFPQYMNKIDLHNLINTNILFMQFGKNGNSTSPTIPISTYRFLTGNGIDKNYIVLQDRGHTHIKSSVENMQDLLKPLEALLKYSFDNENNNEHYQNSLEGYGKNNPLNLGNQFLEILPYSSYGWRCIEVARDYQNSRLNPMQGSDTPFYLELFEVYIDDACNEERIQRGY